MSRGSKSVLCLLSLFALLLAPSLRADPELPLPPVPFVPGAQMVFDCLDGPGYLRITAVNDVGQHQSKTVFLGSRQECLAQAAVLRKTRRRIERPSILAVCGPNPTYMVRWAVYPSAAMVSLSQVYYESHEECLQDALDLNSR